MRQDSDFAAYVAARWPTVVRTLVLLGAQREPAERVARTGLARCYAQWDRVQRADDLDTHVYRTVLACWERRRPRWLEGQRDDAGATAIEQELDRLAPDVRAALVLGFVAGLSEQQVVGALDGRTSYDVVASAADSSDVPGERAFRAAGEGIDVLAPPPTDEVIAEARAHGRRRRRALAAAAAGLVAVVGLGTWAGTRTGDAIEPLSAAKVRLADNPAGVAWWATDVLHLEHVTVDLPGLTGLAVVTGGAVYGDEQGRVLLVTDDGARQVVGRTGPGAPIEVSVEQGWAAWVDPGPEPELVVYDLAGRQVLDRRPVAPGSTPVGVEPGTVYYSTPQGSFGWAPGDDTTRREAFGLLDVASGTRVRQAGPDRIEVIQPFPSVTFVHTGVGAQLSPDGDYVLTRVPDPASTYGTVRIYDTRSGDEVPSGLAAGELAVSARPGADRTVTYVVAGAEDRPEAEEFVRLSFSGPLQLRTCSFDLGACVVEAMFPSTGSAPVLAH